MQIQLYTTLGCHLCAKAESMLRQLAKESPIEFVLVEIAEGEGLVEQYGLRIPVLRSDLHDAELGWPFEFEELKQWMHQLLNQQK